MADLAGRLQDNLDRLAQKYNLKWDNIAVGVSGGSDSLALILLLHQVLAGKGCRLAALTVNHHLREEADDEAAYVADLMKRLGIEHHILDWNHGEIVRGLEEKARVARYDLLQSWCRQNNFDKLMTAHHQKDQAETFVMRLQRGSGVDGLASIAEVSYRQDLCLVRPMLDFMPEELQNFLQERGILWMTDASNDCDDFLRVRIRKLLPILEKEIGLSAARIAGTARALNDVKEYISQLVGSFIADNVQKQEGPACSFCPEAFAGLHFEIKKRVLASLLKETGGCCYAPTFEELSRLCRMLSAAGFKGCTLAACEIIAFHKRIWVIPESKERLPSNRKQWEQFVREFPAYKDMKIPYKLKNLLIARAKEEKPVAFCKEKNYI